MQELKITNWCDTCNAESGTRVEATASFVVSVTPIGVGRPPASKRLDLCENHSKPVTDVAEMLKVGTPLPKDEDPKPKPLPRPRPEPQPEPAEPKPKTTKRYPSAERYRAKILPCPVCGVEMLYHSLVSHLLVVHDARPYTQPKKCPDCGKRFDVTNAMATHRRRVHGWDHLAELANRVRK